MTTQHGVATNSANRKNDTRTRSTGERAHLAALDPRQMSLAVLARHCAAESEHFYRGRSHDTRFAYELFRRAVVERDEMAWEHVYIHYSPLVEGWVRRSGAFASCGESSEFFVGAAFTKFWRAMSPERFATFPTLAALLQYLQLCTSSVVIDSVRAQSWSEMVSDEALPPSQQPHVSPDEQALERLQRAEFWRMINTLLNDDAERAVVIGSFVLGLKPGEIYDDRPELFGAVGDVYNVKRNVLSRLSRNPELRRRLA
jgi:DNA-directed RNA polymerase specialized sigma24 family protein